MIDSGATGNFLDLTLATQLGLVRITKTVPEAVHAVDGSELTSGMIRYQTEPLLMRCENGHMEQLSFDLIDTPTFGAILGIPWLQQHNPKIDWYRRLVTLDSLGCVNSCYQEPPDLTTPLHCATTHGPMKGLLPDVYREYTDVCDKKMATQLPPHRTFDCKIDLLPGVPLPCSRIYALTEPETQYLKEYLKELLDTGFIRHSTSPVSSPLFLSQRKMGDCAPV